MLDLLKEFHRAKIDIPINTKHPPLASMRCGCMEMGLHT
jgi:hypothetical protein